MSYQLTAADFGPFLQAVQGHAPFPWQVRLAAMVCDGTWPDILAIPTGCGKTTCIDIAVFAMAVRGTGPRRVFFVVDRRLVVDQAYQQMKTICKKLSSATDGILWRVRKKLEELGGLPDAYQMRGGIQRDDSWMRRPDQPMLIASTVDQTGSRLLFRGYGASEQTWPMHAGLVSNDSLILLDEAHCSEAFAKTVASVQKYRSLGSGELNLPFHFVRMSATPGMDGGTRVFQLGEDDKEHEYLRERLRTSKRATFDVVTGRPRDVEKFAGALATRALEVEATSTAKRIAVMVNRVKTARLVHQILEKNGKNAHLLTGRMRPVDRRHLAPDVEALQSGNKERLDTDAPVFVVATQCLEVGADLDFDALITECASIDALLQRFGRLDRLGEFKEAAARVVASTAHLDPKHTDPVYGTALRETGEWLQTLQGELNFALVTENGSGVIERLRAEGADAARMRKQNPRAAELLPTHLDLLVQTSPTPEPDPDISVFLHGRQETSPDIQLVFRSDLSDYSVDMWEEVLSLAPPVAAEALPVPLSEFRRWLTTRQAVEGSDVESTEEADADDTAAQQDPVRGLIWRGPDSVPLEAKSIRPGDTIILEAHHARSNELGTIPAVALADAAELARASVGKRALVRLHPAVLQQWPETEQRAALLAHLAEPEADSLELPGLFEAYQQSLPEDHWLRDLAVGAPLIILYPTPDAATASNTGTACVLGEKGRWDGDTGADEGLVGSPITLEKHLMEVKEAVQQLAARLLPSGETAKSLVRAAELHDIGKADLRFQALLRGGDWVAARCAPLIAKSTASPTSRTEKRKAREAAGLPSGFRHELSSLSRLSPEESELVRHLIAVHHGYCRPFAPFVEDPEERSPAHRLDSGVTDRFWKLTRRFGWWGLPYLETVMRLGDWDVSSRKGDAK